jgi:hypothetical protein
MNHELRLTQLCQDGRIMNPIAPSERSVLWRRLSTVLRTPYCSSPLSLCVERERCSSSVASLATRERALRTVPHRGRCRYPGYSRLSLEMRTSTPRDGRRQQLIDKKFFPRVTGSSVITATGMRHDTKNARTYYMYSTQSSGLGTVEQ